MKPLSFVYSGMIGQGGFAMETPRAEITMMASLSVASVDGRVMFQGVLSPGGKITFFTLPGPLLLMDRQYMGGQMSRPPETFLTLVTENFSRYRGHFLGVYFCPEL